MVQIELLRKFSLFKELDDEQLQKFAAYVYEKRYQKGGIICSKGGRGDEIFLIKRGRVSIILPLYRYDSRDEVVSELEAGDFFGELSFFDGQERSAHVKASAETDLLILSRRDYDKIIKDNPRDGCKIQGKIIASLVGLIRDINQTYASASFLFWKKTLVSPKTLLT
ncbi:MAG: cyclic nucleotide-binding domain-containing protein [Elusimicrobia bacterium]|nr:cyclic nucleotide-binding domain-containing protein [Elusimicrobiota bacterium]